MLEVLRLKNMLAATYSLVSFFFLGAIDKLRWVWVLVTTQNKLFFNGKDLRWRGEIYAIASLFMFARHAVLLLYNRVFCRCKPRIALAAVIPLDYDGVTEF